MQVNVCNKLKSVPMQQLMLYSKQCKHKWKLDACIEIMSLPRYDEYTPGIYVTFAMGGGFKLTESAKGTRQKVSSIEEFANLYLSESGESQKTCDAKTSPKQHRQDKMPIHNEISPKTKARLICELRRKNSSTRSPSINLYPSKNSFGLPDMPARESKSGMTLFGPRRTTISDFESSNFRHVETAIESRAVGFKPSQGKENYVSRNFCS